MPTETPAAQPLSFNPFAPGYFEDPYTHYAELRENEPVHVSPFDTVMVFRYDDVLRVLRDSSLSVEEANASPTQRMLALQELIGDRARRGSRAMLNRDPPDHTRLRRLVSKAFTPRTLEDLRPRVQQLVDELLDQLAGNDDQDVDLIHDFAFPLPFTVISEMLGMPDADRDQLRDLSHTLTGTLEPGFDEVGARRAIAASDQMIAHVRSVLEWKRANPADDLLTRLIQAEDAGDVLTEEELLDQVVLLYIAGHETTVNLIGNGVWSLLRHRSQLERLRDDPSLDVNAIEELLRFESPVQLSRRITTAELEIAGVPVPAGRIVVTILGAANRDPAHFGADADQLDLRRPNANEHVSFGSGVHHCLGSALARLEGQVAIGTLLRRFPGLEPAADRPDWNGRIVLRGLDSLPVALG